MILLKMKIFLNNLVHLGFHIIRFTIVKEDMCAWFYNTQAATLNHTLFNLSDF